MLLVRLPVNSRLSVVKFLDSQKLYIDFQLHGGGMSRDSAPKPHIVQGSTIA